MKQDAIDTVLINLIDVIIAALGSMPGHMLIRPAGLQVSGEVVQWWNKSDLSKF